jgi:hypothetical protein
MVVIMDNAMEETRGDWNKVIRKYLLSQRTTEPHSLWQNRAEIKIRNIIDISCMLIDARKPFGVSEWSTPLIYVSASPGHLWNGELPHGGSHWQHARHVRIHELYFLWMG